MMKRNSSGKILVVFLVIFAVLLISLTAISMFFLNKEIEKRKIAEESLQDSIANGIRLDGDIKDFKKKNFLLEEKNKDADERINSLMDELELEQGLRGEMKEEVASLKKQVNEIKSEKKAFLSEIDRYKSSKDKIRELESRLQAEKRIRENLESKTEELEKSFELGKDSIGWLDSDKLKNQEEVKSKEAVVKRQEEVKLEPIVVNPKESLSGRILSVDRDTEFVIVNLGSKDGLAVGNILSVYRGKEFLGDIQISRVQPEMSAADLIPPFSSQRVRKNDEVVVK